MMAFSKIFIIYNPKSTGSSRRDAEVLRGQILLGTSTPVDLVSTEYAGHAREIAQQLAETNPGSVIISSSGDGGYHEVVNGVMDSGKTDVICAVLPAGNANDHANALQREPLIDLLLKGRVTEVDLLQVNISASDRNKVFAHSYLGLGLTPAVAVELNRHSLNAFREMLIVIKSFIKYRPFKVVIEGETVELDSLILSNVNRMAKVLTFAESSRVQDGKFEVHLFRRAHKIKLLLRLGRAAVASLEPQKVVSELSFKTVSPIPMQLDGELYPLPAEAQVEVKVVPKALKTLI